MSPTLQVDSLPAEPLGKPKNTGKGSLSLLQQIYPTQESNRGLLHCRQILHQLSYQRIPNVFEVSTEKRNDIQNVSVPVSNDCMLTNHHHCQKIYMYTHQDKMTYSYQLWFCVVSCQIHISPWNGDVVQISHFSSILSILFNFHLVLRWCLPCLLLLLSHLSRVRLFVTP